jgi:hypothetical protein
MEKMVRGKGKGKRERHVMRVETHDKKERELTEVPSSSSAERDEAWDLSLI